MQSLRIHAGILLMILSGYFTFAQSPESSKTAAMNKNVIKSLYEQVLNERKLEVIPQFVSEDYVGAGGEKGPAAFEKPLAELLKAFPDVRWEIKNAIAEGDQVAINFVWKGTHKERFAQFEATNKMITNDGMAIFTFRNGKIVGQKLLPDRLGVLQQMGIIPQDPSQLVRK